MGGSPVAPRLEAAREEVLLAYKTGASIDSLADRFGCSATPIRGFLVANGIEFRPPVRPKRLAAERNAVIAAYRSGRNTRELAATFGVDRNTVSQFLKAEGARREEGLAPLSFTVPNGEERGVFAGLLLGEGSIVIHGRSASVRISNQDAAILGWLAKFGGRIYWAKPRKGSPNPCAAWDLSGAVNVFHCLSALLPLLMGKKKSLARAALKVIAANYGLRETPAPAALPAIPTNRRPSCL
jgi:uncharacterized protein (DUF433 family)